MTRVKDGTRALGVAESYREDESTLAGAVVRADRVVDGFEFGRCTVGGTDATSTVRALFDRLDRPDVQYVLVAGIAPAWYNLLDLHAVADHTGLPVLSVTFEESQGLEAPLQEAFEGDALETRLSVYRSQPARRPVSVDGETVYVRAAGLGDENEADVVRAFTPEGGRPEPLRVARLAARGADALVRDG